MALTKAWVAFTAADALPLVGKRVLGVTRTGPGDYLVTLAEPSPNLTPALFVAVTPTAAQIASGFVLHPRASQGDQTLTTIRIRVRRQSGDAAEPQEVSLIAEWDDDLFMGD